MHKEASESAIEWCFRCFFKKVSPLIKNKF